MSESYVQLPSDGSGKKLHARKILVSGDIWYEEYVLISGLEITTNISGQAVIVQSGLNVISDVSIESGIGVVVDKSLLSGLFISGGGSSQISGAVTVSGEVIAKISGESVTTSISGNVVTVNSGLAVITSVSGNRVILGGAS